MKSEEELNALREEAETLSKKLTELTNEELAQVSGGLFSPEPNDGQYPAYPESKEYNVNPEYGYPYEIGHQYG